MEIHTGKEMYANQLEDAAAALRLGKRVSPWMLAQRKESYCQARQEDDQRKSIVQQIMHKRTDFLRRINVPVWRAGKGHTVVRVPTQSPISA